MPKLTTASTTGVVTVRRVGRHFVDTLSVIDPDDPERRHAVMLPKADWEAMGCPTTLSVTIKPGD